MMVLMMSTQGQTLEPSTTCDLQQSFRTLLDLRGQPMRGGYDWSYLQARLQESSEQLNQCIVLSMEEAVGHLLITRVHRVVALESVQLHLTPLSPSV